MSREYPARPIVGIGVIVLRQGEVLLIRRGKPPNEGMWSLPGGGQELGERAEEAARRELLEETGLEVGQLHLAANVDSITHDGEGRIQFHYTILDFAARWAGGTPRAGGDAAHAAWVRFEDLHDHLRWSESHRVIAIARGILGL